jgi:hypothetical protein
MSETVSEFLKNDISDYEELILNFIDSPGYNMLKEVARQKYINQLEIFHTKIEPNEMLLQKCYLDVWLNICDVIKNDADTILQDRKNLAQEIELQ